MIRWRHWPDALGRECATSNHIDFPTLLPISPRPILTSFKLESLKSSLVNGGISTDFAGWKIRKIGKIVAICEKQKSSVISDLVLIKSDKSSIPPELCDKNRQANYQYKILISLP
jgi:hypothetical protein